MVHIIHHKFAVEYGTGTVVELQEDRTKFKRGYMCIQWYSIMGIQLARTGWRCLLQLLKLAMLSCNGFIIFSWVVCPGGIFLSQHLIQPDSDIQALRPNPLLSTQHNPRYVIKQ